MLEKALGEILGERRPTTCRAAHWHTTHGEHGLNAAGVLHPRIGVSAYPRHYLHRADKFALQVALVDRLMVRYAVSQEVQTLDSRLDVVTRQHAGHAGSGGSGTPRRA